MSVCLKIIRHIFYVRSTVSFDENTERLHSAEQGDFRRNDALRAAERQLQATALLSMFLSPSSPEEFPSYWANSHFDEISVIHTSYVIFYVNTRALVA